MSRDGATWKTRQRTAARRRRAALDPEYRRVAEHAIAVRLQELVGEARVVAAYAAGAEEVQLDDLLTRWLRDGRDILLPRVTGPGRLTLHRVGDLHADLREGAFGIREPDDGCPLADPASVGVVLVPGVAFDRTGRRIGQGGAFYDRLLPTLGGALRVGVCYEAQLVDQAASEPHDELVDAVVTEGDVYR